MFLKIGGRDILHPPALIIAQSIYIYFLQNRRYSLLGAVEIKKARHM